MPNQHGLLVENLPFKSRRAFEDWEKGQIKHPDFPYPEHISVNYAVCSRCYVLDCNVCGTSTGYNFRLPGTPGQRKRRAAWLRKHKHCGMKK
jgi:hypothetical protein